jgi:hypothetical protein
MRDLARGAEQTSVPGLADVQHRRVRRQRNIALTTGLAVIAVLGSTALLLNPLGDNPTIQPVGPGPTVTLEPPPVGPPSLPTTEPAVTAPDRSEQQTSQPASSSSDASQTGGQTSSPPSDTAQTSSPPDTVDPILAIEESSLVTQEELAAAGVPVEGPNSGDLDGQPTLPQLCTATDWQEQYSNFTDFVSGSYPITGGTLLVDLLSYPSAAEANLALVKLKEDARACPTVNEFASVEVTAVGSAIGEEFVVFRLDSESGQDGSVQPIWITIARTGNVLVSAAVTEDDNGSDTTDNEQQTLDAAAANVEHLQAG